MCGIAGKLARDGKTHEISSSQAEHVLRSIHHRGPDMQGQFSEGPLWLGHVRLSILDLSSAGSQPMSTPDNRYVICYNGEVYNFAELAKSLNLTALRGHSDTEVILRAFAEMGPALFPKLNGMFAFSIYDRQKKKLWLVRDRLGIKPLFYSVNEQGIFFASEIKALTAMNPQTPQCDSSAIHEWLYYGTTHGERTLYRDIRQLLPGHFLELDLSKFELKIEKYWSPLQYAGQAKIKGSASDRIQKTRDLLEQAVQRQLVSDVPVGIFLSGGIDSSAITAFASRHYKGKLATYSVGFDFDKGINELPIAKKTAQLYGTNHHEMQISGFDVSDIIEKMVQHHDRPFSDAANIPLFLLSSKISQNTKVVLQGDGGDEMFGGYSRYSTLSFPKTWKAMAGIGNILNSMTPHRAGYYRRLRYIHALQPKNPAQMMALLLTEEDPAAQPEQIFSPVFRQQVIATNPFAHYQECWDSLQGEDLVNQMLLTDSMVILPDIFLEKVDRSTMAASVEVRVPFLDHDLVDFCMRLSGPQKVRLGQKKWLLKKALDGIVPDEILYGKKMGFGVPYGYWLRQSLRPLFFDHLQTFQRKHPDILDESNLRRLYEEHSSQARDRSFLLWKTLNFMIWANQTQIQIS